MKKDYFTEDSEVYNCINLIEEIKNCNNSIEVESYIKKYTR